VPDDQAVSRTGAASPPGAAGVRVRFAPSPTGDLHVGNVRTALFNYAFARHTGGTLVLRIEDTDRSRSTEASYAGLLDELRWLGLRADEGPDVGGPWAPYRQSQRLDRYADIAHRLADAGRAYPCFCTQDEVRARNAAAGRPPGYDNHCRALTVADREALRAQGRPSVLRLAMPGSAIRFDDLIHGEVCFDAGSVPDFVLVRADGHPMYPLTNPVDDALMRITHVLRGEDLLSSTPRQIALYDALAAVGVGDGTTPAFGHLPFVLGEGNRKLSKRTTPEASLGVLRERGFLPEGVLNSLALLGWSMGEERELFSLAEMCDAFTLERVSTNSARFDVRKMEAINGVKIRELPIAELAQRITPFIVRAGLVADPPSAAQSELLAAATPLVQERIGLLSEAVGMLGFLFVDEADFAVDETAAEKTLGGNAAPVLDAAYDGLSKLASWQADDVQATLERSLVDGLGLGKRKAYAPVRVAVTGRTVSPPLFESIELLRRDRTLRRLQAARDVASASP
jgi:glutamyl-tRNA synthetase